MRVITYDPRAHKAGSISAKAQRAAILRAINAKSHWDADVAFMWLLAKVCGACAVAALVLL